MSQTSKPASMTQQRHELELLLCCARPSVSANTANQIQTLLQHPLDWKYLRETANRHGVIQLLYWNLNTHCPEHVPQETLSQLRAGFQANTARNLIMTHELIRLLQLLEDNNIPALPFKGSALAASAYGNIALRTFGDLDILVHKAQVLDAKALLISQGYRLTWEPEDETEYLHSHHQLAFSSPDDKLLVEIQWGFAPRHFSFPINAERLWEHVKPLPLAGTTVLQPSLEDQLLLLCSHGGKHCWSKLAWISDIAAFTATFNKQIDWDQILTYASQLGGLRLLLLGLQLAHKLLGTELPDEVKQRITADSTLTSLVTKASERLFNDTQNNSNPYGAFQPFEAYRFHIKSRERLRDKLPYVDNVIRRYLRRWLIPNEDDRAYVKLPHLLTALYYVVRPIRLARKHGTRWFRAAPK